MRYVAPPALAELTHRAQTLTSAGDLAGARRVLATALDPADATDPRHADPDLALAAALHARILIALGDPHGARLWAAFAHAAEERLHGSRHERTVAAAATHAAVLQRVGHFGKAAQVYHRLVGDLTMLDGPESPRVLAAEADLATAEHAAGDCTSARARLTDAWIRHRHRHGDSAPAGIKMLARLGAMERECARDAESAEHLALAQELCARYLPPDHPLVRQVAALATATATGKHVCGRVEQSTGPLVPPTRDPAAHGSEAREDAAREAAQRDAAQRNGAQRDATARSGAQREAAERNGARQEAAARDAAQREAAWRDAAQREAARREAALRDAPTVETAPQRDPEEEAARREVAARVAAGREAAQKDAALREAALREAPTVETVPQEAPRPANAWQEEHPAQTAHREAAEREAAEREAAQREAAQREAGLREAAQRAAGRPEAGPEVADPWEGGPAQGAPWETEAEAVPPWEGGPDSLRVVPGEADPTPQPREPGTRTMPFPRRPTVPDPEKGGVPPADLMQPPPDHRPTDPNGSVYQQPLYLADVHQAPGDLTGRHARADTPPPMPGRAPDYGPDGRPQPVGSAPASTLTTPPNSERLLPVRTERPVPGSRRQPFLLVGVLVAGIAAAAAVIALTLPDANGSTARQPAVPVLPTGATTGAAGATSVAPSVRPTGPILAGRGAPGSPAKVTLRDNRDSVSLTWAYPAGAEGPVLISGGRAGQPLRAFQQLPAGTADYIVYGLNEQQNYCFTVAVAYSTDRIAASAPVCTRR